MRIRKGDTILVVKGKDKGKKAKVLRGFPKESKVLVEGVNIRKVHKRARRENEKGQVVEMPSAISLSKIKLVCPKCNQPARVGYQITGDVKARVCKKCKMEI